MTKVIHTSLIICSRNRPHYLERCLDALDSDEIKDAGGEIVLVNNGSTDATEEIMQSFKEKSLCKVEVVNEHKVGLSNARNAGVKKAKGEILVFTDDDCYLSEDYFLSVHKIFSDKKYDFLWWSHPTIR